MSRVGPAVGLTFLAAGSCLAQQPAARSPSLASLAAPQAFLQQHCIECHNSTDQSAAALFAGLFFDKLDVGDVAADPETWEKVVRKLGAGMMPPASEERPDAARQAAFLSYLETELDARRLAGADHDRHRLAAAEALRARLDELSPRYEARDLERAVGA